MKNGGITSRAIEKLTKTLIARLPQGSLPETLPPFITQPLHLLRAKQPFMTFTTPTLWTNCSAHKCD